MKKILALMLATLMLAVVLTACGTSFKNVDQIKKEGKLIVYTEAGFAPYEFMYNNKIVGVDVKIMEAVAEKLGVELVVEDVAFDTICTSVKSGKADVGAAGITINDERKEEVDFSIPYTSTTQYVVVKIDNTSISTLEDLVGKSIGVQQGTTSDIMIDKLIKEGTLGDATLTGYAAPAVAAASLGKIDAVVTDMLTAETIVANNPGLYKTFKLVKADGSPAAEEEFYGIAVGKGNTTLLAVINEVLEELKQSGKIKEWELEYSELAKGIESET